MKDEPNEPTSEGTEMAYRGQTIVNRASGERITFRHTAADTAGELLAIDLELPPGRRVPGGLHVHPAQEERFEVVRGSMAFHLGGQRVVAGPGEVVVVPPGVAHDFANAGAEAALVRVEVRPALGMERLFASAAALAEQGRTYANGIPRPLDLALMAREFEAEVHSALAPRWVQRLALAPLVRLADGRERRRRVGTGGVDGRGTCGRSRARGTSAGAVLATGERGAR